MNNIQGTPQYHPHIDGLRAIAVLAVIFFHADISFFSGGFVGVDVFFVISGYLITTIIYSKIENNTFSLLEFYIKRIKRLIPALFFMMLCCLPFAWFFLLPSEMKSFGKSLIGASTYTANIVFWKEGGYFGVTNELKPLLHTWSLAVEEQFYILFPLFLIVAVRFFRKKITHILFLCGFFSLVLSEWGAVNSPYATFLLLPTRGFELLLGCLLAFICTNQSLHLKRNLLYEGLALLGLLFIILSVIFFDKNTKFPGVYALIPTFGSVLLIALPNTLTGRLLSSKPLVTIGLMSYSIYLWHQPILAFSKSSVFFEYAFYNSGFKVCMLILCLILSYFSWKYIENPFRYGKCKDHLVLLYLLLGTVFFSLTGYVIYKNNGFENRKNTNGIHYGHIADRIEANYGLSKKCTEFTLSEKCRTDDLPEIVLWGDSYAMHLASGIKASNPKVKMIQFTKSGCSPIFDVAPSSKNLGKKWSKDCVKFNNKVKSWLKNNKSAKYVVMASPFNHYTSDKSQIYTENGVHKVNLGKSRLYLKKTLETISNMGFIPVLVAPPPWNNKNIGFCLTKYAQFNKSLSKCNFKEAEISQDSEKVYKFLDLFISEYKLISLKDGICEKSKCNVNEGNVFIYKDSGHLSYEGSSYLGKKMNFYDLILESQ